MITDIAVERVEFRCPESHWQSVADYDVVTYADTDGAEFEFYSKDGVPTLSPYTISWMANNRGSAIKTPA